MRLHCEVCQTLLHADDVRFDLELAKCHACNAVYALQGHQVRELATATRERPLRRPKAVRPENFRVEESASRTAISWRWLRRHHLVMVFFCISWDAFLVSWYSREFTRGASFSALLFPLLHVSVGIFLTYWTLAGLLNTTRIEVSRDELSIQHGPLPWAGSRTLPGREFTQLFGQEVRGDNARMSYSLLAIDKQGRQVKLLSGLEGKEQVLYLEQTLERLLGIEESPVEGVPRRADEA